MARSHRTSSWYPPRTRPRDTKTGIRARTKRGSFGKSWWARRWIEVLEGFDIGARLARGRNYARRGQVTEITVKRGEVTAAVQGSRSRPYTVSIGMKTLKASAWKKLAAVLGAEAHFLARLLSGELPEDIEKAFTKAGLSLFPKTRNDLQTGCSCPDWSNPCKHIAAVYYLLGEEFDRNPFLILKLRGLERGELMKLLDRKSKAPAGKKVVRKRKPKGMAKSKAPAAGQPLPVSPESFWGPQERRKRDLSPTPAAPPAPAALLRRLGDFPFWRGMKSLPDALAPLYEAASRGEEAT